MPPSKQAEEGINSSSVSYRIESGEMSNPCHTDSSKTITSKSGIFGASTNLLNCIGEMLWYILVCWSETYS